LLQKGGAVERAARILFVLEVDVDVAILCEGEAARGELREFGRAVTAAATHAKAGVGGGGMHLGGLQVLGLGDAEGCVVLTEEGIDGVNKPAWVAELEGDGRGAGFVQHGAREEIREQREIEFEVRGKLEEQKAELAGLTDGLERVHKLGDESVAVAETLEMGDALRRLEAETKASGSGGEPVLQGGDARKLTEGVVHLNRVELGAIKWKEFLGC
jgi:hypothetical protein